MRSGADVAASAPLLDLEPERTVRCPTETISVTATAAVVAPKDAKQAPNTEPGTICEIAATTQTHKATKTTVVAVLQSIHAGTTL